MTNVLAYDRYCAEIIEQTRIFRDTVKGVALDTRVPTCPEWTVRDLAVHVGNGHRRAAEVVRTRATSFLSPGDISGYGGPEGLPEADVAPEAYSQAICVWLSESAHLVSDELRVVGEESHAWTFTGEHRAAFWARRRTHETLVHRVDAALAAGAASGGPVPAPGIPADLAADCLDEFLELTSSAEALAQRPQLRTLSERAGETLHLHVTDGPASFPPGSPSPSGPADGQEPGAGTPGTHSGSAEYEWLIRIGEEGFTWERAHEKATTAVRGPLTDLLLVLLRRLPADGSRVEVLGEKGLLDFWLERVGL